jgi:hypothetical protein
MIFKHVAPGYFKSAVPRLKIGPIRVISCKNLPLCRFQTSGHPLGQLSELSGSGGSNASGGPSCFMRCWICAHTQCKGNSLLIGGLCGYRDGASHLVPPRMVRWLYRAHASLRAARGPVLCPRSTWSCGGWLMIDGDIDDCRDRRWTCHHRD